MKTKTLADVIAAQDEPYKKPCDNCKGKGAMLVNVRANELRVIDCPVCTNNNVIREESHAED